MATQTNTQTTTTSATPDVKIVPFRRNLRVPLSDKEIAERAQRAAHLLSERDHKDEEMKAAAKHAKAQIAEVEAELRRVSGEIRDGATYKDVECQRRHNYRLGKIEEVRLDSLEVIAERAMTDQERQLDLALPIENKKTNGANGHEAAADPTLEPWSEDEDADDEEDGEDDDADPWAASDEEEDEADIQDEQPPPEPVLATQKKRGAKRATRSKKK